jgi:hypothetical protein
MFCSLVNHSSSPGIDMVAVRARFFVRCSSLCWCDVDALNSNKGRKDYRVVVIQGILLYPRQLWSWVD